MKEDHSYDRSPKSPILIECRFGKEHRGVEIEDGPNAVMTLLKARQLRTKWSRGLRKWHPKTFEIQGEIDPWEEAGPR